MCAWFLKEREREREKKHRTHTTLVVTAPTLGFAIDPYLDSLVQAAKSVVAAGLARRCLVQVSYAIGVPEPLSVFIDSYGTGKVHDAEILEKIKANFDFRPGLIGRNLDLKRGGNVHLYTHIFVR